MSAPEVKPSTADRYAAKLVELQEQPAYARDVLRVEIAELVHVEMERRGITRKEMARRLNCRPRFVRRILEGSADLSLTNLAAIGIALGVAWDVSLKGAREWIERGERRTNGKIT